MFLLEAGVDTNKNTPINSQDISGFINQVDSKENQRGQTLFSIKYKNIVAAIEYDYTSPKKFVIFKTYFDKQRRK